ncbi:MAG: MMPL family transporter [Salinisphaeraceae bacterium]|nr:MMPL family transporter [Salinisphaeraceae bacterium]
MDESGATLLSRWYRFSARRTDVILIAVLLFTAIAVAQIIDFKNGGLSLEIDPSINNLLPADDPALSFYNQNLKRFGSDETVVIAIADIQPFTQQGMARLNSLHEALIGLPGVHKVMSLPKAPNLRAEGDMLDVGSFAQADLSQPNAAEQLYLDLQSNPLYRGTLLSEDGKTTAIIVTLKNAEKLEGGETGVVNAIRKLSETQLEGTQAQLWITGTPVIKAATTEALLKALRWCMPGIAAVLAAFLLLAFHSVRGVLLPALTISIALLWVFGLMAMLGRPLNLITTLVPPVIMTIGLAYCMHVLSDYYSEWQEGDDIDEHIYKLLDSVGLPLLVTGVTTAAGFLALALSPLSAIREFALLSAVGVLSTVALSLTFLPSILRYLGCPPLRKLPGEAMFASLASGLANFDVAKRRLIMVLALLFMAISLYGASGIKPGTNYIENFPPDSQVRQDFAAVNTGLGGANNFSIVLTGAIPEAFIEPAVLAEVQALQHWLEEQPEIGATQSMVDHLMLINRSLNEGDPNYFRIPNNATEVAQLLMFGGGDELKAFVDTGFRHSQIKLRTPVQNTEEIEALVQRIEQRLDMLSPMLSGQVTGSSVLITRTVDAIVSGQWLSIGTALFVVYLVLWTLFTSWRVGLLAMLPNALPVVFYFGALGYAGITLNTTTSLVACIVLGIAVDDTVHYLARFNAQARDKASELKATYSTLRNLIRPITLTSATLVAGFLVLTSSDLRSHVEFGALAALTLAVAWVSDVVLTPAIASGVRIVTLWDSLRLDLGRMPQYSIPLFEGLSVRQARIFALMSDLQNIPAGTRVITEGEKGGDIYVVIEGKLDVWVERDGERVELNTMRRGMTIGEVGHFSERRTANIDAISDVRLLRFNDADLERLVRRYPRIAAIVFRNLNRVQAKRVANSMNRMN